MKVSKLLISFEIFNLLLIWEISYQNGKCLCQDRELTVIVFADMTMALIDAANDKTEDGQEMISQALFDLGKHKPALVLSSCYSYLKKHTKVGQISNNVSLCRI